MVKSAKTATPRLPPSNTFWPFGAKATEVISPRPIIISKGTEDPGGGDGRIGRVVDFVEFDLRSKRVQIELQGAVFGVIGRS